MLQAVFRVFTVGPLTSEDARWIQLPVLFYPGLESIHANGRKVDYVPLDDQDRVLAAVRLAPGTYDIHVQFQGLVGELDQLFFLVGADRRLGIVSRVQDIPMGSSANVERGRRRSRAVKVARSRK
ncbi:MAG: hypothetical protein M1482_15880 [Chloroflexi bacterium]|nr:hypothetical protein [Chloroflexota bacterium]